MSPLSVDALMSAEYVHSITADGDRVLSLIVCPAYRRIMFRVTCGGRHRFESNNLQLVLDRYHDWATHPPSAVADAARHEQK